jgi:hypothetical protein
MRFRQRLCWRSPEISIQRPLEQSFFAFLSALPLDPCNSFGIQLFDRFKKESMKERDQYDYWTFVL